MTDAVSPFLNLPLRSESEARAAGEQTERERRRRLEQHGADFCRRVLDGAYERVYQPNGDYRLREVTTGAWLDEQPSRCATPSTSATATPDTLAAARRYGYDAALRDMTRWIAGAAIEPRLHAETLTALNAQIVALADRAASTGEDVTEPA